MFVLDETADSFVLAKTWASPVEDTTISPPAATTLSTSLVERTRASTSLLTRFVAKTVPTARLLALMIASALEAVSFPINDRMLARISATVATSRLAVTVESMISATTRTGRGVPRTSAPAKVSSVCKNRSWASQPTVLIAKVPVTPWPRDTVLAIVRARIKVSLVAVTETSPAAPVVTTSERVISASAEASTRLVAITPLIARLCPCPNKLPPDDSASLSMLARIDADSSDRTESGPATRACASRR